MFYACSDTLRGHDDTDPVLAVSGVSKRFGATWANRDISLAAYRGEVHAVVGENGAGKSTLMAIIYGHMQPDSGSIRIDGQEVRFHHPRDAIGSGIGMIHQQLLVFPQLNVLQNIVMGREPRRWGWVSAERAQAAIEPLLEKFGFDLPLDYPAGRLSHAHRQQLELLKLLYREARILILDEPTSLLSNPETERLLILLRHLKDAGKTLFFVSHRLVEVLAVADRITVLRRGRRILSATRREIDHHALVAAIMGESRSRSAGSPHAPRTTHSGTVDDRVSAADARTPVLRLIDVSSPTDALEAGLEKCSFELGIGEILGMGAIVGNGLRSLAAVIAGSRPIATGDIELDGTEVSGLDIARRIAKGVLWLPADPEQEATLPSLPLWENFLLGHQRKVGFSNRGILRRGRIRAWVREGLDRLQVNYGDLDEPLSSLSGGNRQRVILSRLFKGAPKVLVLEQPTRGLDIKARHECYSWLRQLSDSGTACLLCSYDIDELMEACDRIGILYRGRLMGLVGVRQARRGQLSRWLLGRSAGEVERVHR